MNRIFSIALCLFLSACSLGPLHITHTYGEMPRAYIDTGMDECKLRPKLKDDREIMFNCKWKY